MLLSYFRLADERKEEGNQLYKLKNYREALQKYSEAIGEKKVILVDYFGAADLDPSKIFSRNRIQPVFAEKSKAYKNKKIVILDVLFFV